MIYHDIICIVQIYNQNVFLLHYNNATSPKFPTHSTFPNHLTICLAQRAWRWERIRSTTYQQSSCTMLQPKPKRERQSFRAPRTYITHNLRYCDTCTFVHVLDLESCHMKSYQAMDLDSRFHCTHIWTQTVHSAQFTLQCCLCNRFTNKC